MPGIPEDFSPIPPPSLPGTWTNMVYCHACFLYMQVVSFLPSFKEALAPRSVTFAEGSSDTWCSVLLRHGSLLPISVVSLP